MQSEGAKSRREFFRKNSSHSVACKTIDETDMTAAQARLVLMAGSEIQTTNREGEGERLTNGFENEAETSVRSKIREPATSPSAENEKISSSPHSSRLMFQRRSLTDPGEEIEAIATARGGHADRKEIASRSASSPSLVLSKVKEKIRKKVASASDWRDSKAMTLEKFSSTTPVPNPRGGRAQEKKRSLSEVSRGSSGSLAGATSGDESFDKSRAGIVCSSRDLEAILNRKPTNNTKAKIDRSLSMDASKFGKNNHDKLKRNNSGNIVDKFSKKHSPQVASHLRQDDRVTPTDTDVTFSEKSLMESLLKPQKVKEVEFDEQGETWEVYGADFDPEVLGDAIQKHLKRIESKDDVEELVDTNKNDIKSKTKARKAWWRMFESIRQGIKKNDSTG